MGKRKSKAKPPPKKRMDKLDTVFSCPFCNHGSSVECRIDMKTLIGEAICGICQERFSTTITALTEAIDIPESPQRGKYIWPPTENHTTRWSPDTEEGRGTEDGDGESRDSVRMPILLHVPCRGEAASEARDESYGLPAILLHVPCREEDEAATVAGLPAMAAFPSSSSSDVSNDMQLPLVFVGGKLFGGLDRLMASHISDELVPILSDVNDNPIDYK
ncbi:hypothetical protein SAY86_030405 [Trapa natans]|uniref:Transcription elongation factor 1 homolog n=1 Tax=Trapa natans TaxID=22666 RepID=A0AAN7RAL0_TRANT|nr:hypothetical protein SAY86_030405 [Trapa natans]